MNGKIFREYDIRGHADNDLNDMLVRDFGAVFARRVFERHPHSSDIRIVVGRDCRLHSWRLFQALTAGLRTCATVIDIGDVPTPATYFAAHHVKAAAAIMITGSHNPASDNGFKMLIGEETLHGTDIADLRDDILELRRNGATLAPPIAPIETIDIREAYLHNAKRSLRLGKERFRIVLDAGNGSGGPLGAALYRQLGFDVDELYCAPDGTFPNHHPDPTVPANLAALSARVKATGAHVGLAFDGDADRLGVVDEQGEILWGDNLLVLLGRAILREVPNAKFIGEVKCSDVTFSALRAAGGQAEMWKVGHSLIKARMRETHAELAGEMSGHLFFRHRYLGFDDAIYAGARVLEILSQSNAPLSSYFSDLPPRFVTPEIRIACPDELKRSRVDAALTTLSQRTDIQDVITIDGVRAVFPDGWGLVRASNTEASLVLRAEGVSAERRDEILDIVKRAIES